jgi:murein L,D-transpeptidase YcbB/YkuD
MAAGRAGDPRLAGWREAYGQADGDRQVEGWDFRQHRAVTSDSSHLWHIHLSESREHVQSYANKEALLSVLRGEPLANWQARRPAGPSAPPWPGRLLTLTSPRMRGDDVRRWQQRMRDRGWRIDVDGIYGPQSAGIARQFQREKGLQVDGIVGPRTWAAAWTAPIT